MLGIAVACTGSSLAMTAAARASRPGRRSFVVGLVPAFSLVGIPVIALFSSCYRRTGTAASSCCRSPS
jgi:hypothetical protein